jgi:DNA repair protein SbcD/Mre11
MKFLHISDIHLGCTRYNLPESPRDFFDSWISVLQKYAIDENVDFVIMCGDFFHKRSVPPETMDYAVEGLNLLRIKGIPVVAIEGNHDQRHTDSEYSWLRSLSNWDFLILLEPEVVDNQLIYKQWDVKTRKGGFVDIGEARIFGSNWYGAAANWAMPMLTDSIRANSREGAFQILMLHTDVEGYQAHPSPSLRIDRLRELKAVTNYVGLGHTHKHYVIDNWCFNPGSLEITSIDEFKETRGAFVVDVDEKYEIRAIHTQDYIQRPFQRILFDVTGIDTPQALVDQAIPKILLEARCTEVGQPQPIIEVVLHGQLGFPASYINSGLIRDFVRDETGALFVKFKNGSMPKENYNFERNEDIDRLALERKVIEDLVIRDSRFKTRSKEVAEMVIQAKRMALSADPGEEIAEFLRQSLFGDR